MKHDLELKVLAGVHAGAKARLHGDRVVIGASDDCDVVLAVDDVAAHHAALVIEGGEVFVEPLDGEVMRPDGAPVSGRERLDAFAPLCLGATWIAVAEAGASWPRIDPASLHPRRALPSRRTPRPKFRALSRRAWRAPPPRCVGGGWPSSA